MTKLILNIALVDDHVLFRSGMRRLIDSFDDISVVLEASDGDEFTEKIQRSDTTIDVVLLDVNMKVMDGYQTSQWLKTHYPEIKILALSMYDDEAVILKMINCGAHGYVLKDAESAELNIAIKEVHAKGYYYTKIAGEAILQNMHTPNDSIANAELFLNERELEFLKLSCSELTYKEIADRMNLSTRTIDGYRDKLFEKLHVRSRVGLVLKAVKMRMVVS